MYTEGGGRTSGSKHVMHVLYPGLGRVPKGTLMAHMIVGHANCSTGGRRGGGFGPLFQRPPPLTGPWPVRITACNGVCVSAYVDRMVETLKMMRP